MGLKEKIQDDIKTAMKARDSEKVQVLRMVYSEIRRGEIDSRTDFTDEDVIKVIKRGIKSRQEAIALYEKGNRPELVEKESNEVDVLTEYMPKQLSMDEIENIVEDIIAEHGLSSPKDMGTVMRHVMQKYSSQVDGKIVQEVTRLKLRPE